MTNLFSHTPKLFALTVVLGLFLPACASKTAPNGAAVPSNKETSPSTKTVPAPVRQEEVAPFFESAPESELPAEEDGRSEIVTKVIGEEVEEEIAKTADQKTPTFDFPIVMNTMVQKWINYFQTRGRDVFTSWLGRAERYVPMMKRILRENGLPEDLIYLAMIESGFKPYAYSPMSASGQWQFIKSTGSLYGLRVDWWIDERNDPEKSTLAAAQHLKDLYDRFNSWYLAAAGYNAGQRKIENAIRRYSTEDFWEMSRYRYLKPETKNYVPKIIAAALLAKEPAKYGFTNIQYEEPYEYDRVTVPEATQLSVVAEELGVSEQSLSELNPELRRGVTPPTIANYELKVPKGMREKFIASYPAMRKKSADRVVRHVVKRKETLAQIARGYGVNQDAIVSLNRLKRHRLKTGQQLAIPVGLGKDKVSTRSARRATETEKSSTYKVRKGDTIWSISRSFDVTVAEIRSWNRLASGENIRPGQKLRLQARSDPSFLTSTDSVPPAGLAKPEKSDEKSAAWKSYTVKPGDSLWSIAKENNVNVSDLSNWNNVDAQGLRPGMQLKIQTLGL